MAVTIDDLPEEMLIEVLKLLDGKSVKEAALVCKEWNRLVSTTPAIMKRFLLVVHAGLLGPSRKCPELMSLERHFTRARIEFYGDVVKSRPVEVVERYGNRLTELHYESSSVDKWDPHLMLKVLQLTPNLEKLSLQPRVKFPGSEADDEEQRAEIAADKVTLKKLKKLEDNGNRNFYSLIEAPQLKELKFLRYQNYNYNYKQHFNFKNFEKFLKASSTLESLEANLVVFNEMEPNFSFQLKKIVALGHIKLSENITKFLMSQAATVQKLEAKSLYSEFYELVLTNFKQLRTLKANLDQLAASDIFYNNLEPMPSLTEISSLSGFSSERAIRAVLGNCPALRKLECREDRKLPDHLAFIAEHNKNLEVFRVYTVRDTFAAFQCLKELIVMTVENTEHLVCFLKLNPTVETLDINQWLNQNALRVLDISSIINDTKIKRLKMNGFEKDMDAVYSQIKSKFGCWTELKLSSGSESLEVDIIREKRPRGTKREHSPSM